MALTRYAKVLRMNLISDGHVFVSCDGRLGGQPTFPFYTEEESKIGWYGLVAQQKMQSSALRLATIFTAQG